MSAHEKAAKARARMEQVRREMAERRALRARNARAVRERAAENLRRQGPVAAQVAKHMGELGRRRAQAGGWATEKTERDRDYIMGFGAEDEQAAGRFATRPLPVPPREEPATGPLETLPAASAPPPPPPTPLPTPLPTPPARRSSRDREVLDDEDDFSNQSTWLRNQ